MKPSNPTDVVETGYENIARTYHDQRDRFKSDDLLTAFSTLIPSGGAIVDVGCGAGVPVVRFLVDAGFTVTGVDNSAAMIELAQTHVPEANFQKMDMRQLDFPDGRFDGLTAFYSIFHIPRNEQCQLLVDFYRLLRPDGILLFCSGVDAWEGFMDFHGVKMFWSHPEWELTSQWVIDAGFNIMFSEIREYGGEKHHWIMAKKIVNHISSE